jgi:hypothetical protein
VAKPRGDLGAMVVPKATAAQAVPHTPLPSPPPAPAVARPAAPVASPALAAAPAADQGPPKALTVKLDGATYRRLRRHCQDRENATGKAPTHQEVMVAALLAYLTAEEGG